MSKRRKMSIVIFMIMMIGIFTLSTKVEAALQANGAAGITANLNDWVYYTRKMQEPGGGLGLTDQISDTDLTSANKNFDVHFQKNTEYGAIAILSASAYGNPDKIADGQTTTGNASGIQVKLNGEWKAAGPNDTLVESMKKSKARYWNNYGTGNGSNSKAGDAMAETNGWHGSTDSNYLYHACLSYSGAPYGDCAFVRSAGASMFGFWGTAYNCGHQHLLIDSYGGWQYSTWCQHHSWNGYHEDCIGAGLYTKAYYGRASVVVGSGV